MNPKNRNKFIILGVLGAVLAFFLFRMIFGESEQDRKYRENMEKSAREKAAGGEVEKSAAPTPVAAGGASVKSQFQKSSVNVDQLISSIREVDFNYDTDRTAINPMTPLVGPAAHKVASNTTPGSETPGAVAATGDSQSVQRTYKVTGILWDKRDPMAVVNYPLKGKLTSEIVQRGYKFPDTGIVVNDVQQDRVVLNVNGTLVSLQLEER